MIPSLDAARETIVSFVLLAAIFLPLERAFALHRQRVVRAEFGTDVLYFLCQYLAWALPVLAVLHAVHAHAELAPLAGLRAAFAELPLAAQLMTGILISDVCVYWAHRFSHANAFLWRFHSVHHTSPQLDWLAAHREHPLDNLYTRLVENLPLILLGFPLHLLAGFATFRGLWALYIHSNVALRPGPLRFVLGSPRLHHWHHEPEVGGRVNFANLNPLMDLVFGTYHDPGRDPERYGTGEASESGGFVRQILAPLVPARIADKLSRARSGAVAIPGRRARSRPSG